MDAPWHYAPASGGKPSRRIDECPLEWYFGRGVVLNMTHKKSGETVSAQDEKDALAALDYTLSYGDIVCIRKQPEVENGEIAAVRIGEEATLKRFYRQGDTVMLQAENPAFSPLVYTRDQLNEITIEGRVVGICRGI